MATKTNSKLDEKRKTNMRPKHVNIILADTVVVPCPVEARGPGIDAPFQNALVFVVYFAPSMLKHFKVLI